jgi:hypothetical protein
MLVAIIALAEKRIEALTGDSFVQHYTALSIPVTGLTLHLAT